MQISILNGIYLDNGPDVRISYPVNMVPVPTESGVSAGALRPADGIVANGSGPGVCRGGIEWRGVLYRVLGSKFCSVSASGAVTEIGDVGEGDPVRFTYGFDRLAIVSNLNVFYWDETSLTQLVDPDLGAIVDGVWIDGYFMFTDGDKILVTELNDPTSVVNGKYDSGVSDPDRVVALKRMRNEVYSVNRNSIEGFANVGGNGFPFARIEGAKIPKGAVGTFAVVNYLDALAFVGSGYNEAPGVYLGVNAQAQKISTVEVDRLLASYTEEQLSQTVMETRNDNNAQHLYIHLVDRTMVYDAAASQALGSQVWFVLTSALRDFSIYRARYFVWCFDRWNAADPASFNVGYLTTSTSAHYGDAVRWEFGTSIIYNESRGAIINELELVSLTGRVALGKDPVISTAHSYDGQVWTQERAINVGSVGNRLQRIVWFRNGSMSHMRMQRFRGTSDAHVSFLRLEAQIEGLAV